MSDVSLNKRKLRSDSVNRTKERNRTAKLVHEKLLLKRAVNQLRKKIKKLEESNLIFLPRASTPQVSPTHNTEFWSFQGSQSS